MTTTDSKGIIRYEAGDSVSPLHTALNLGLDSVSTALDNPIYNTPAGVHVVANSTELAPLRTTMTTAGYPTSDPLYAHRKDTGELYVQETSSSSWESLSVQDTGWINLTLQNGWESVGSNFTPQIRRKGSTVFLRGRVTGGTPGATIFNVGEQFRASVQMSWVVRQSGTTSDVTTLLYQPSGNFNTASTSTISGNASIPNLYITYAVD